MKIITWNVNGLRAAYSKGFLEWFKNENPGILCLQETKLQEKQIPKELKYFKGYNKYWNYADKKGYSGTVIFTKQKPISVSYSLDSGEFDSEGRLITLEYDDYFLTNIYAPHSRRDLSRLNFKIEFYDALINHLEKLKKPTILCGDFNIAHKDIDLARPKDNANNAGFTKEERTLMDKLLALGLIDTLRQFNKEGGHYTWWSYMHNAREKNIGWRIDYVLVSKVLRSRIKNGFILSEVAGSDHCPTGIEFE